MVIESKKDNGNLGFKSKVAQSWSVQVNTSVAKVFKYTSLVNSAKKSAIQHELETFSLMKI